MIAAIGAVASNGMLGLDGWLPWDIPEELAYFEETVAGAALVIGRPTRSSSAASPDWHCVRVASRWIRSKKDC